MHNHEAHGERNRGERRSRRRGRVMAAGLVALGLSVAGCSAGSSGPGVASVGSSSAAGQSFSHVSGKPSVLAFAQCMQSHGIKNFPEPNSSGGMSVTQGESLPDFNSPQYRAAAKACVSLDPPRVAPNSAQQALQLQNDIAYAKCMRSHGVTNFPDPNPNTGNSFGLKGIDVNSSQVQAADKACGGNSSVGINQHTRTSA